ncbi:histidinol dehydrogenase [Candidatus Termititenax persephonae]|uniref:Histidinol dehydrogenase n=1 Tax=Candidatus Termititenax persephonae TaxID=2218525 RepID=A0A388TGW4_9BACT|nr:histidinol dehydrogenase [Candidatus Termititenax persephonae]
MLKIYTDNIEERLRQIAGRAALDGDRRETKAVARIIKAVRKSGDRAVLKYTRRFDRVRLSSLRVDPLEIALAREQINRDLLQALRLAIKNIADYHLKQVPKSWLLPVGQKSRVGLRYSPLAVAGVYVPGGRAAYPSSLLMSVIPAKLAGVPRICVVTPPAPDGSVPSVLLAAAHELGIAEIYLCGGAQAVAALAYGTETIPRADLIVGPGNIYMTLAKKLLYGVVGFDKLAGPSDCLILADKTAQPELVAADLLAQSEHDPLASSLLITDDASLAKKVVREVERQIKRLSRREIIEKSLRTYGAIFVIKERSAFVRLADLVAPEHLQIMLKDAGAVAEQINNAGAIFMGAYSPVALGDYFAGPNHVLPTGGTSRFASPLGVDDFIKKTSLLEYSKSDLKLARKQIDILAKAEGLTAHASSVDARFGKKIATF